MIKRTSAINVLLVSLLALAVMAARADDETSQFDILHSNASVSKKWEACQRLRVIGTAKAVPEVAALLTDERLSQAARQTLEGLPYPEVDDVLRDALSKTSGLLKAGVVDSIGWRGKPASVALLTPLLSDADTNVAAASATALGRIGGREAIAALSTARDQSPPVVQAAVLTSLLQCANRLEEKNDKRSAAAIFRELHNDKYPVGIRMAAWRGLVFSDSAHQGELMLTALRGTNRTLELAAIQILRETNDRHIVRACASQWASLTVEAQLAVIDAAVKQGANGLRVVRDASHSQLPVVRVAAWTALGEANDLASIPALAHAAAAGANEAERQTARDSLVRLQGANASKQLLAAVKNAATPEKAELLQVLGARQDGNATKVLLQNAAAGDATVRRAALDSLGEIAPPEALSPLLDIAVKGGSDDLRQHALDALAAVCQASSDKDAASRTVVESMERLPAAEQGAFFNLLAGLGTSTALAPVQAGSRSQDLNLAKQAVRALSQWPNAAPVDSLLELARTSTDAVLSPLALSGAIAVTDTEPNLSKRVAFLKKALEEAHRPEEKKEALGKIGQISTPEALAVATSKLADPDVPSEAAQAVVGIAEKLSGSHPQLAHEAAAKVLEQRPGAELFQRVWPVLKSGKHIPFVRDWVACGPYSKPGVAGATAIFNVPFGPELRGEKVDWKEVPSEDRVGLAKLFPGEENCDAYLRTTIVVPADCSAMLLTGSDDGLKAWLNGTVVQSKNVDRPDVVDDDVAPITLKQGANELVLKISQGGGGWSACARIVGADGNPIEGLKIERPTGGSGGLAGAQ